MSPGLLYVTMQPSPDLPPPQFHDWYNTEHGPLRLRLPYITNGFRYRAVDLDNNTKQGLPKWLALYDLTNVDELIHNQSYLSLRTDKVKTQREKDTMAQIVVDRGIYKLEHEERAGRFVSLEELDDEVVKGSVLVAVSLKVTPESKKEVDEWYQGEYLGMVSKVSGWRRTRRFSTAYVDPATAASHAVLILNEFDAANGLDGVEYNTTVNTAASKKVLGNGYTIRRYQWYYTFGPAPRELASLAAPSVTKPWSSNDGLTRTFPHPARPAVESFVTTSDGVMLPYRLEGSGDPSAPLIVLSNSILVNWSIWDGFVHSFLSANPRYRILRYLTRGRQRLSGEQQPVTVDLLASDIISLLDALRVPKVALLIGVSLGGVTALNTSLLYPSRVSAFVACDTNSSAPESNRKAWGDRVSMAEKEGATRTTATGESEPIVGSELAEITTRRWLVPETYNTNPSLAEKIKKMVGANSLDGFRHSVQALCAYDVRQRMASATVPGLFVVGGNDGTLPQTMKQMAADLAGGAELKVIENAGHLPMVERPEVFTGVVNEFLGAVGRP